MPSSSGLPYQNRLQHQVLQDFQAPHVSVARSSSAPKPNLANFIKKRVRDGAARQLPEDTRRELEGHTQAYNTELLKHFLGDIWQLSPAPGVSKARLANLIQKAEALSMISASGYFANYLDAVKQVVVQGEPTVSALAELSRADKALQDTSWFDSKEGRVQRQAVHDEVTNHLTALAEVPLEATGVTPSRTQRLRALVDEAKNSLQGSRNAFGVKELLETDEPFVFLQKLEGADIPLEQRKAIKSRFVDSVESWGASQVGQVGSVLLSSPAFTPTSAVQPSGRLTSDHAKAVYDEYADRLSAWKNKEQAALAAYSGKLHSLATDSIRATPKPRYEKLPEFKHRTKPRSSAAVEKDWLAENQIPVISAPPELPAAVARLTEELGQRTKELRDRYLQGLQEQQSQLQAYVADKAPKEMRDYVTRRDDQRSAEWYYSEDPTRRCRVPKAPYPPIFQEAFKPTIPELSHITSDEGDEEAFAEGDNLSNADKVSNKARSERNRPIPDSDLPAPSVIEPHREASSVSGSYPRELSVIGADPKESDPSSKEAVRPSEWLQGNAGYKKSVTWGIPGLNTEQIDKRILQHLDGLHHAALSEDTDMQTQLNNRYKPVFDEWEDKAIGHVQASAVQKGRQQGRFAMDGRFHQNLETLKRRVRLERLEAELRLGKAFARDHVFATSAKVAAHDTALDRLNNIQKMELQRALAGQDLNKVKASDGLHALDNQQAQLAPYLDYPEEDERAAAELEDLLQRHRHKAGISTPGTQIALNPLQLPQAQAPLNLLQPQPKEGFMQKLAGGLQTGLNVYGGLNSMHHQNQLQGAQTAYYQAHTPLPLKAGGAVQAALDKITAKYKSNSAIASPVELLGIGDDLPPSLTPSAPLYFGVKRATHAKPVQNAARAKTAQKAEWMPARAESFPSFISQPDDFAIRKQRESEARHLAQLKARIAGVSAAPTPIEQIGYALLHGLKRYGTDPEAFQATLQARLDKGAEAQKYAELLDHENKKAMDDYAKLDSVERIHQADRESRLQAAKIQAESRMANTLARLEASKSLDSGYGKDIDKKIATDADTMEVLRKCDKGLCRIKELRASGRLVPGGWFGGSKGKPGVEGSVVHWLPGNGDIEAAQEAENIMNGLVFAMKRFEASGNTTALGVLKLLQEAKPQLSMEPAAYDANVDRFHDDVVGRMAKHSRTVDLHKQGADRRTMQQHLIGAGHEDTEGDFVDE